MEYDTAQIREQYISTSNDREQAAERFDQWLDRIQNAHPADTTLVRAHVEPAEDQRVQSARALMAVHNTLHQCAAALEHFVDEPANGLDNGERGALSVSLTATYKAELGVWRFLEGFDVPDDELHDLLEASVDLEEIAADRVYPEDAVSYAAAGIGVGFTA